MTDSTFIKVEKAVLIGSYSMIISSLSSEQVFDIVAGSDGRVLEQESVTNLETALKRLGFEILFVDHNRVVRSTYSFVSDLTYPDTPSVVELNRIEAKIDWGEAAARVFRGYGETDLKFPLLQVVAALERSIRTQAFRQGAAGEQSATAVYLEIAKSLSRDRRKAPSDERPQIADVVEMLVSLRHTTESFVRHGLLSEYPFDDFISIYKAASKAKKIQIESVLSPFLDSIERRTNALTDIHKLITTFEGELSKYFIKKRVQLHILDGLQVLDEKGRIPIDVLSSGEKQLVFLLCAAALARSKRSVILIDEPGLSLNYKWQRMVAGSLANISAGGETQYILASHSIEIITRYVDSSFELML